MYFKFVNYVFPYFFLITNIYINDDDDDDSG